MPFDSAGFTSLPCYESRTLLLSDQEIFDQSCLAMKAQGKPSARLEGDVVMCDYRNREGLRCAVGALLQDSEYSLNMENQTVRMLAETGLLPNRLFGKLSILEKLQHVHDAAAASNLRYDRPFWPKFKCLALGLAYETGLSASVLQD